MNSEDPGTIHILEQLNTFFRKIVLDNKTVNAPLCGPPFAVVRSR